MFNKLKYFIRRPLQIPIVLITKLPFFSFVRGTKTYDCSITFEFWFMQKVLNIGDNKRATWPVHYTSVVRYPERMEIGLDTCPGMSKGCYIQGRGGIKIGDYTFIAQNVVIVSTNHDVYDKRKYNDAPVEIGKYCWLGAGCKIMPGVKLGDFTVVGAGAVVTKSFEEGYCIIGGVAATKIKDLDRSLCIQYEYPVKYYGYLSEKKYFKLLSER